MDFSRTASAWTTRCHYLAENFTTTVSFATLQRTLYNILHYDWEIHSSVYNITSLYYYSCGVVRLSTLCYITLLFSPTKLIRELILMCTEMLFLQRYQYGQNNLWNVSFGLSCLQHTVRQPSDWKLLVNARTRDDFRSIRNLEVWLLLSDIKIN